MTATQQAMKPMTGDIVKPRVFSGIKPSGALHLGNYLGAIRRWVEMQDEYDNVFCIVDLHAITVPQEPQALRAATHELAATYMAAGLSPEKCILFAQSHVSAHAECAWLFNCLTPLGWAERMTQYKDKAGDQRERSSVGLLAYPMLMAADILLYHANGVPVGEDQKQHVELTRDIAERFNRLFGEVFTVPEAWIGDVAARVMGLDDPTKKMSKSEGTNVKAIMLTDTPEAIRSKIKRATTDSIGTVVFDESRPGIFNLLSIYQAFNGESRETIEGRFAGQGYGAFKKDLADIIIEGLRPLQERYAQITAEPGYVERILKEGADRARPIADETLANAKRGMGLL
ncbi:MAG: tryptophan--tRNA ligase [Chloroflexota bacterium]|nr:tryptophan--tRNA ligase [Chloroflexota bacterium]